MNPESAIFDVGERSLHLEPVYTLQNRITEYIPINDEDGETTIWYVTDPEALNDGVFSYYVAQQISSLDGEVEWTAVFYSSYVGKNRAFINYAEGDQPKLDCRIILESKLQEFKDLFLAEDPVIGNFHWLRGAVIEEGHIREMRQKGVGQFIPRIVTDQLGPITKRVIDSLPHRSGPEEDEENSS